MGEPRLPAWLTSKVDQRLQLLEHRAAADIASVQPTLVLTPLTEPPAGASPVEYDRWDRTCDCCGKHCPHPVDFYTGQVQRQLKSGVLVIMTFGVCKEHSSNA